MYSRNYNGRTFQVPYPQDLKFKVILADCPWEYSNRNVNGAAQKHYPTLDLFQLKALPVNELASEDAVLFLWCTNPQLPQGLDLIKAWGFNYVTKLPWIKFVGDARLDKNGKIVEGDLAWGTGWWARGVSEDILIAKRGHAKPPEVVTEGILGLLSKRSKHSAKPKTVHTLIEEGWSGPYLELFAREKRNGWYVWGDEVESDIDIWRYLPEATFKDKSIQEALEEIRTLWNTYRMARWRIGDILIKLHRSYYIPKMRLFKMAARRMAGIKSPLVAQILYHVALAFPPQERDINATWGSYRQKFVEIQSEKAQLTHQRKERIKNGRRFIDKTFFELDEPGK